nr:hypothetical protein [Tanacetum cinerariifolium]
EGTGTIPRVLDVPTEESDEEISWKSSDEGDDGDDDKEGDDGDDDEEINDEQDDDDAQDDDDDQEDKGDDDEDQEEGNNDDQDSAEEGEEFIHLTISTHDEEETRDEESFDPIPKTPENTDDEGNGEENLGRNVGREEGQDEEDEEDKLYRGVNINIGRGVQMAEVHTTQELEDSHLTLTLVNHDGQQQSSSVSSQFVTSMLNPTPDARIENSEAYKEYYAVATGSTSPKTKATVRKTKSSSDTIVTPPLTAAAGTRLFSSAKGKQPAITSKAKSLTALSWVAMTEAQQLKLTTKRSLQQTHISKASGSGADEGTGTIPRVLDVPTEESDEEISWKSSDEGDDVKEQVKVQVSKILPKIKQTVNEQLEAKVLTRLSNSSKTSYVVAADLS